MGVALRGAKTKNNRDMFRIYIYDSVGSNVHFLLLKVLESTVRNFFRG